MNCLMEISPKNGYGFIYRYTSPSGKNYIGQTRYSLRRRSQKNGKDYKNCPAFYSAIQKYGFENFTVEILEECLLEELDVKEAEYIKKYNSLVPCGYNIYPSGSGVCQNKSRTAVDVYDLECNYIASFPSLIDCALEYSVPWQAISACIRREIEYYKDKIYTYKGKKPSLPHITKTHGRITAQYDLNGNLLKIYNSANEAARAIGKNSNAGRNIRLVAEGKRQTAFGYKWKFLD